MKTLNLVWFRRDLRLEDNEIVAKGCSGNQPCLPFFIIDPYFYHEWSETSTIRTTFLFESLESLDTTLQAKKSGLNLFEGNSEEIVSKLLKGLLEVGYTPVLYFNLDTQINYGISRDQKILQICRDLNVRVVLGKSSFLVDQKLEMTDWRKNYQSYNTQPLWQAPNSINTVILNTQLPRLSFRDLKIKYNRFWTDRSSLFTGGEPQAQTKLDSFLSARSSGYHWKLSQPWLSLQGATSHLSAHIAFGTITSRYIIREVSKYSEARNNAKTSFSLKAFLERLRWRDSFLNKLYLNPEQVLDTRFAEFRALHGDLDLSPEKRHLYEGWKAGQTGFPLVDASMRQLRTVGWLNFRMRAMVATFLCINCGISWKLGALHFMNCLADGDAAIDHWQWQMQAGITNPLSPAFRIYDPTKNLVERDPEMLFVRHWLPELKSAKAEEIIAHSSGQEVIPGYISQILDFKQTKQINGKVISDLRKQVREKILTESDK